MSFKKQFIKALETDLYSSLGYRERQKFHAVAVYGEDACRAEKTCYGTIKFISPIGSFEVAWTLPGYKRGTVVG